MKTWPKHLRWFPALAGATVIIGSSLAGCGKSGALTPGAGDDKARGKPAVPAIDPALAGKLAEANHALAFDLYGRLVATKPKANLTFSPHSVSEVLALAYRGAHGETAAQIAKPLHLELPGDQLPGAFGSLDRFLAASDAAPQRSSRVGLTVGEDKGKVKIEDVTAGSSAEKAGLKKGQVIVAVDGQPVHSKAEFHATLADRPGPVFQFEVEFGRHSTVPYRVTTETGRDQEFRLEIANALWGRQGLQFQPDFLEAARCLGAAVEDMDFRAKAEESRRTINEWISRKTNGHIKEGLAAGALRSDTALILTNAVYFTARWQKEFSSPARPDMFHGLERDQMVKMMDQTNQFRIYSSNDLKILEMPFQGTPVVMNLILPDKGIPLATFEKDHFTADNLMKWLGKLTTMREREVHVKVPRFEAVGQFDLKEPLCQLGMPLAFSPKADFSGLSAEKNLALGMVAHRAVVTMDEQGVVASAATAGSIVPKAARDEESRFIADRPFLFVLRDGSTNTILFLGRVTEPEKAR
jgi:serine protease inhibitor